MLSEVRQLVRFIAAGSLLAACLAIARPADADQTSRTIDVVAVIEPELSLTVRPETGERLDLGVIPSSLTETRPSRAVGLQVQVSSNLGAPYEVTHQLVELLTSAEGAVLPPGSLRVSDGDVLQNRAVEDSPVLLVSDAQGRSSTHDFSYHLDVPPGQAAGAYRGTLVFSVTAR